MCAALWLSIPLALFVGCADKQSTSPGSGADDTGVAHSTDSTPGDGPVTSGPTGDPEVVECVANRAECTAEIEYNEKGFSASYVWGHNACGLLTQVDAYANDELLSRWELTYDADNFLVEDVTTLAVGSMSWRWEHHYDELRLRERSDFDERNDGTYDGFLEQAYDAQRRITRLTLQFDGQPADETVYTHTGDDLIGSESTDRRADGRIDLIRSWDRTLPQPLEWIDHDGDGEWEEQVQTTLAPDGQPLEAVATRPDGEIIRRTTWRYDADGRVVEHTIDERDDGSPDEQTLTAWTCP